MCFFMKYAKKLGDNFVHYFRKKLLQKLRLFAIIDDEEE